MITCPKCGKELPDGIKFCNACGAPIANADSAAPASEPKAKANVNVNEAVDAAKDAVSNIIEKVKALPKKTLAIGAGGVVALIVVIALIGGLLGGASRPNCAVYIKDDELHINMLKGKESIEITSDFAGDRSSISSFYYQAMNLTRVTPDGKTVIYPDKYDGSFDLYYRSTTDEKADEEKIASGVTGYVLSADGKRIIYKKDGGLYEFDFKDSEKIDSDVTSYWVTEDCKTILYQTNDGDLYKKQFGKDEEKLEKDVSVSYVSDDLNTVVLRKDDKLYIKKGTKDKEKIESDVYGVVTAYEDGKMYFVKQDTKTYKYADFVNDTMKDADANAVEPEYPYADDLGLEYPQRPSSSSYSIYYWEDLEEYADCESYSEAYELYNELYDAVDEQLQAARDKYYEDRENYYNVRYRNQIREYIENNEIEIQKYSLYFYDGKTSTLVAEGISTSNMSYTSGEASPALRVEVIDYSGNKKVDIAEYTSTYQISSAIRELLRTDGSTAIVSGKTLTKVDDEDMTNISFSYDGKTVYYFTDVDDSHGNLMKMPVSGGKAQKVDEDVYTSNFTKLQNGDIYYFKDMSDKGCGELCKNGKTVADDVYRNSLRLVDEKGNKLYYIKDYSYEDGTGELCLYNGKEQKITSDAYQNFYVTADGGVLYFEDYENGSGDLFYSVNGKEGTEIDDDVQYVVYY